MAGRSLARSARSDPLVPRGPDRTTRAASPTTRADTAPLVPRGQVPTRISADATRAPRHPCRSARYARYGRVPVAAPASVTTRPRRGAGHPCPAGFASSRTKPRVASDSTPQHHPMFGGGNGLAAPRPNPPPPNPSRGINPPNLAAEGNPATQHQPALNLSEQDTEHQRRLSGHKPPGARHGRNHSPGLHLQH